MLVPAVLALLAVPWGVPATAIPLSAAAHLSCTITGTDGPDVLPGTAGADVICGLGGDDVLTGGRGDDVLSGGAGRDILRGGSGDDLLLGGTGTDTASYRFAPDGVEAYLHRGLVIGFGHDRLRSVESLQGSRFADVLSGDRRPNQIDGLGGADRLLGHHGADTLKGGPGYDRLDGGPGIDSCLQGAGRGPRISCERAWLPLAFASAGGVTLEEPAAHVVAITYHESLFRSAAALRPQGHLILNDNPRFRPPPSSPGPGYLVMRTRHRGTPPTSASDVVLDKGTRVLSPVSGTVVSVTLYRLYCEVRDIRVIIRPDANRHVTVMVLHVTDVSVHAGQHVVASWSRIGVPRALGVHEQEYDYVPGHHPHVHLELEKNGSSPLPGC
jgi:hemolysin type calcium-binding protein